MINTKSIFFLKIKNNIHYFKIEYFILADLAILMLNQKSEALDRHIQKKG